VRTWLRALAFGSAPIEASAHPRVTLIAIRRVYATASALIRRRRAQLGPCRRARPARVKVRPIAAAVRAIKPQPSAANPITASDPVQ
jgi:hypothetical protein